MTKNRKYLGPTQLFVIPLFVVISSLSPANCSAQKSGPLVQIPTLRAPVETTPWILDDASLRAVRFYDADRGWAVGDFGAIFSTVDGGTNWIRRESGVRCKLLDVVFRSPKAGFAVGGWVETDTGLSRGVLLRTSDGGETWNTVPTELAMLNRVWVMPSGGLLVFGQWSTVHQGRLLFSEDDGLNWESLDGRSIAKAQFADVDAGTIYVVDEQGIVYRTESLDSLPVATSVLPNPVHFKAANGKLVVVTADQTLGKQVLTSDDQGRSWQPASLTDSPISHRTASASLAQQLNYTSSVLPDGNVLLTGTVGKKVTRLSANGLVTDYETRSHVPLHDLFFLDQYRGWAVGAYGNILATRDGGQTWRPQRLINQQVSETLQKRAMLLGVSNHPISLPWPAIATQSMESGHRVAIAISAQQEVSDDPVDTDLVTRCSDAALRIGASEVVQWTPENIELILDSYRPSVVVLGSDLTEQQRNAWLDRSIQNDVTRVFETTELGRGDVTFTSSSVLPIAAALTGDLWASAIEIIEPHYPTPDQLKLQRRFDRSRAEHYRTGLADGLSSLGAGRSVPDGRRRNVEVLQARSNEKALVEKLFRESPSGTMTSLEERLNLLIQQTPVSNKLPLLRSIISEAQLNGDRDSLKLYILGLAYAAENYSETSLGRWARTRYSAMSSSAEWHQLLAEVTFWNQRELNELPTDNSVPAYASPFERMEVGNSLSAREPNTALVLPAAVNEPFRSNNIQADLNRIGDHTQDVAAVSSAMPTLALGLPPLKSFDQPMYWTLHPALICWRMRLGLDSLDSFDQLTIERLAESATARVWSPLFQPAAVKPLFASSTGGVDRNTGQSNRPLLDGILDEKCWEIIASSTTTPASEIGSENSQEQRKLGLEQHESQIDLRFAYDGEFFYLGVSTVFDAADVDTTLQKRQRDADLSDQPHVVVSIDTDRDLLTTFELSVDRLGRTRDTCDGFVDWQPRWYVASKLSGNVRTIEAAIRREDLVGLPPVKGERWRVKAKMRHADKVNYRETMPDPRGWRDLIFD